MSLDHQGPPDRHTRPVANDANEDLLPDDPRLIEIAEAYLKEFEAGRRPDRRQWLQRYPELAAALGPCLEGLDLVQAAAMPSGVRQQATPPASAGLEPLAASPLGDFQIVREIGRGGMGVVYEAVQLSLGRRVALKVLPLAATFDAKQLQRFRLEAQAAAQLHHTNIVPVYGVGCERGIHFYAMQLIDGLSLDAVLRQLREEAGLGGVEDGQTGATSRGRQPSGSRPGDSTVVWSPAATSAPPRRDASHAADPAAPTLRQVSGYFSTVAPPGPWNSTARSPARWPWPPKPWNMPISKGSCIATSNRPI